MITSALINQCRRLYNDIPISHQAQRNGDGQSTIFNVGRFPVIENSYSVYLNSVLQTENTHYTLNKDNGDLTMTTAPNNGVPLKINYQYANFRDLHWIEAINHAIESLNSYGFFRQVSRDKTTMHLSANVSIYNGPSQCIDLYEVLYSDNNTASGNFLKLPGNWRYDQDSNKLILGYKPSAAGVLAVSYLRKLKTYSTTSATLDVPDDWIELLKLKSGAYYYQHMASKIAAQGAATIDEGHFSFTNLRTLASDLDKKFQEMAIRKKPPRPYQDIQWHIGGGGVI